MTGRCAACSAANGCGPVRTATGPQAPRRHRFISDRNQGRRTALRRAVLRLFIRTLLFSQSNRVKETVPLYQVFEALPAQKSAGLGVFRAAKTVYQLSFAEGFLARLGTIQQWPLNAAEPHICDSSALSTTLAEPPLCSRERCRFHFAGVHRSGASVRSDRPAPPPRSRARRPTGHSPWKNRGRRARSGSRRMCARVRFEECQHRIVGSPVLVTPRPGAFPPREPAGGKVQMTF